MMKRSRKKSPPPQTAPRAGSIPEGYPPESKLKTLLAAAAIPLALAAVTFLAYGPSLGSDFIYDARKEILEEGFITSLSNLPAVLSLQVLGMNIMLEDRPGQLLYMMLNAAVWGREPFGYHLCSNLLHATNVALLFVRVAPLDRDGNQRPGWRHYLEKFLLRSRP